MPEQVHEGGERRIDGVMEVEVKAKVDNLDEIKERLESMGALFGKEIEQNDTFFKPADFNKKPQGPGDWILRIRKQGEKKFLTLKALTEVTGAWKEHETLIQNGEEAINITNAMGLVNVFNLSKKRIIGNVDGFELCIDNVKELGTFLEVAIETENESDIESIREKIVDFIKRLGIDENNIERRGYGEIIGEKLGHKFKKMR